MDDDSSRYFNSRRLFHSWSSDTRERRICSLLRDHSTVRLAHGTSHGIQIDLENDKRSALILIRVYHAVMEGVTALHSMVYDFEIGDWTCSRNEEIEWNLQIADKWNSRILLGKDPHASRLRAHGLSGHRAFSNGHIDLSLPSFGISIRLYTDVLKEEIERSREWIKKDIEFGDLLEAVTSIGSALIAIVIIAGFIYLSYK